MKNVKTHLLSALLFGATLLTLVSFPSCDKKEDPPPVAEKTAQEIVAEKMVAGNWPLTTITVDGEDASSLFQNFSITFTKTSYTTTGTSPVWARSGTWTFLNQEGTTFKRDDGIEVAIEFSNSDKTMKLTLTWNQTTTGGRTESIAGRHEFILTRP